MMNKFNPAKKANAEILRYAQDDDSYLAEGSSLPQTRGNLLLGTPIATTAVGWQRFPYNTSEIVLEDDGVV